MALNKRDSLEPQRQYKNITVVIRTFDNTTEEMKGEIIRNIDGPERREWLKETLAKTANWAMFNNCYVMVINKEDDKENDTLP